MLNLFWCLMFGLNLFSNLNASHFLFQEGIKYNISCTKVRKVNGVCIFGGCGI